MEKIKKEELMKQLNLTEEELENISGGIVLRGSLTQAGVDYYNNLLKQGYSPEKAMEALGSCGSCWA